MPSIAGLIFLSPSTVRNHLSTAFRKLGVDSQEELTLLVHQIWREAGTPPAVLGGEVSRRPRLLCATCRVPWWREALLASH